MSKAKVAKTDVTKLKRDKKQVGKEKELEKEVPVPTARKIKASKKATEKQPTKKTAAKSTEDKKTTRKSPSRVAEIAKAVIAAKESEPKAAKKTRVSKKSKATKANAGDTEVASSAAPLDVEARRMRLKEIDCSG